MCNKECRKCPEGCDRVMGNCTENCPVGRFGELCERTCNIGCKNGCAKYLGTCNSCVNGRCGDFCNVSCLIFDECHYNSSKCKYVWYRLNFKSNKHKYIFLCFPWFKNKIRGYTWIDKIIPFYGRVCNYYLFEKCAVRLIHTFKKKNKAFFFILMALFIFFSFVWNYYTLLNFRLNFLYNYTQFISFWVFFSNIRSTF